MMLSSYAMLAIRSFGLKLIKTGWDQTVGNMAPAGMSVGPDICRESCLLIGEKRELVAS